MMASFRGKSGFPQDLWQKIDQCMTKLTANSSPSIRAISDAGWQGFIKLGVMGGVPDDKWGRPMKWLEVNPQPFCSARKPEPITGCSKIRIDGPCNFVSNIAYARTLLEICHRQWSVSPATLTSFGRGFAMLSMGSAFMHASGTNVGGILDNAPIGFIAYLAQQIALGDIPRHNTLLLKNASGAVLLDLDVETSDLDDISTETEFPEQKKSKDPLAGPNDTIDRFSKVLFTPTEGWRLPLMKIWEEVPKYEPTFGALVANVVSVTLPPAPAKQALTAAIKAANFGPTIEPFMINHYLPALTEGIKARRVNLPLATKVHISLRFVGTILKMMYAFFWQEDMIKFAAIKTKLANQIGGKIMPFINRIGNAITGSRKIDAAYQKAEHVYPGSEECHGASPHAKWHEQSANSLVDLLSLADETGAAIRGESLVHPPLVAKILASAKRAPRGFRRPTAADISVAIRETSVQCQPGDNFPLLEIPVTVAKCTVAIAKLVGKVLQMALPVPFHAVGALFDELIGGVGAQAKEMWDKAKQELATAASKAKKQVIEWSNKAHESVSQAVNKVAQWAQAFSLWDEDDYSDVDGLAHIDDEYEPSSFSE